MSAGSSYDLFPQASFGGLGFWCGAYPAPGLLLRTWLADVAPFVSLICQASFLEDLLPGVALEAPLYLVLSLDPLQRIP